MEPPTQAGPHSFFHPSLYPDRQGHSPGGKREQRSGLSLIPATLTAARGSGHLTPSPSSLVSLASGRTVMGATLGFLSSGGWVTAGRGKPACPVPVSE